MSNWLNDYILALEHRDQEEKSNEAIFLTCKQALQKSIGCGFDVEIDVRLAERVVTQNVPQANTAIQSTLKVTAKSPKDERPSARSEKSTNVDVVRLRADLAVSQRTKSDLEARVLGLTTSLATLQASSETSALTTQMLQHRISRLELERSNQARSLRDREEELREKKRLVENVQDEMLGLEMQVNVAEDKARQLAEENKELVRRWMRKIGEEADEVNRGSGWN